MFGFGRKKGKGKGGSDGRLPPDSEAPAAAAPVAPSAPPAPQPAAPASTGSRDAGDIGAEATGSSAFSGDVGDITPDEALQLLKDGNAAFVAGQGLLERVGAQDLDEALQCRQHPFAVIVGCADSRTAPTLLFNQGLGRLFIIRVAGNTIDRRGVASVVYAVKHLHCPLVVVLGHTGCGAVAAAEAVVDGADLDPALEEMITPILPAVITARHKGAPDRAIAAVEENARRVAARLRTAETRLDEELDAGTLKIVAAVKDMKTGAVRFLEG